MMTRRALLAAAAALPAMARLKLPAPVGLQLYSLRTEAEKDLPGTLALVREMGFEEVEVSGLHGRRPAEFRKLLDQHGLHATSTGADYPRLSKDLDAVAEEAHILGARYVVCGTIPHKQRHLTVEECAPAAQTWNRWGETLRGSQLNLCYHIHGIEFDAAPGGTVFDTLARQADARFLNFEMDIFWVVYAYQDPVTLFRQYPNRFPLVHIKDIRKGLKLGGTPAEVAEEDSVALGTGIVNIPAALRAGRESGVRHFYIEDEVVGAAPQIRQSLRYLVSTPW